MQCTINMTQRHQLQQCLGVWDAHGVLHCQWRSTPCCEKTGRCKGLCQFIQQERFVGRCRGLKMCMCALWPAPSFATFRSVLPQSTQIHAISSTDTFMVTTPMGTVCPTPSLSTAPLARHTQAGPCLLKLVPLWNDWPNDTTQPSQSTHTYTHTHTCPHPCTPMHPCALTSMCVGVQPDERTICLGGTGGTGGKRGRIA